MRSLLQLPRLSLDEQAASNFSTRSFRFLDILAPTMLDPVELELVLLFLLACCLGLSQTVDSALVRFIW